jgi:hypothetical protein
MRERAAPSYTKQACHTKRCSECHRFALPNKQPTDRKKAEGKLYLGLVCVGEAPTPEVLARIATPQASRDLKTPPGVVVPSLQTKAMRAKPVITLER